eukprot:403348551
MVEYCFNLTQEYPFLVSDMSKYSQRTYNGRDIIRMEINLNNSTKSQAKLKYYTDKFGTQIQFKPANITKKYVLMVSGQNANSMSSLNMIMSEMSFLIYQFFRGDQSAANLLKLNALRIYPLMNPDGYEYVRQSFLNQNYSTSYDLSSFIKNRNGRSTLCPNTQLGVSIRNNYDYKFGVDDIGSDGDSECMDYYRGKTAFSEVESRAVKDEIEVLMQTTGQNYSSVLFIESHQNQNALIIPNNYIREQMNLLLAQQDSRVYNWFEDLKNYVDPVTNTKLLVGNTIDIIGRPQNGDPNDWIFQMKKILSMTLLIAPSKYNGQSLYGNVFLDEEEAYSVINRNQQLLIELLKRSTNNLKIEVDLPDLCQVMINGKFNYPQCDLPSTFHDLFIYQSLDISNNGRVDTTGNLNLELYTRLQVYKIFMRSSKSQPYYDMPFIQDQNKNTLTLQLPDIEGDNLRNVGLVCIFYYEITNLTSIQDVRERLVYNELLEFNVGIFNDQALVTARASINIQLMYTYLNSMLIEASINKGKFRATTGILYIFYLLFIVMNIIWLVQIKFNVFKKSRRKDEGTQQSAFKGEIELQIIRDKNDKVDKAGDIYVDFNDDYNPQEHKNFKNNQQSTFLRTSEMEESNMRNSGHQILISDVSMFSQLKSSMRNGSVGFNKKAPNLEIDVQLGMCESSQSSSRYLDSTRSLMMSNNNFGSKLNTQNGLMSSNGEDHHHFENEIPSLSIQQQKKSKFLKDPYNNNHVQQPQFIDLKNGGHRGNKIRDEEQPPIQGKVEKISKDQFEIVRHQSKGKIKVIKETDHHQEKKSKNFMQPLQTQIQEEEHETSIFHADHSNITFNHQNQENQFERDEIEEQVQIMSSKKPSQHLLDFYKANDVDSQQTEDQNNIQQQDYNFMEINFSESAHNVSQLNFDSSNLLNQQQIHGLQMKHISAADLYQLQSQKNKNKQLKQEHKVPPQQFSNIQSSTHALQQKAKTQELINNYNFQNKQKHSTMKLSDLEQSSTPGKDKSNKISQNSQFEKDQWDSEKNSKKSGLSKKTNDQGAIQKFEINDQSFDE